MTDQPEIAAVKIIEIMGISTQSFEHAIDEAVELHDAGDIDLAEVLIDALAFGSHGFG